MLTFLHGYVPEVWEAQVKAGLVRDCDGIRFCQNILLNESLKFNELAKKGGKLYEILKERKTPFYIDRLQGGSHIDEYPYDQALLEEYKNMLGDRFWGFQMHEWLSNYSSDLMKLKELPEENWNEESITRLIREKFKGPHLFLEAMTAKEMAEYGKVKTFDDLYRNMTDIFRKRQQIGALIPCDSFMLMYAFEIANGITRIMPEVGAQSADARIQICYARGMTRKEGLHFGVYYEPWGRTPPDKNFDPTVKYPTIACCYQRDGKNEWGIGDSADFPFHTEGENGGGSRSLQKRIFLYSYLSNAEFLSEEWGVCNVFYDWKTFELSPYGKVKKDFIDFMERYPDVGEKLTPIGVVLPKDLPVFDNNLNKPGRLPFPYVSEAYDTAKRSVKQLFATANEMLGSETFTFINTDMPDAMDLFNDGFGEYDRYEYLVDLTSADRLKQSGRKLCCANEVPALLRRLLPCYVEGGLHWLVNRCESGGYYLSVFNHLGVVRSLADGEQYLPEAERTVTLSFREDTVPQLLEGNAVLKKDGDTYRLTVSPADWAFIRF